MFRIVSLTVRSLYSNHVYLLIPAFMLCFALGLSKSYAQSATELMNMIQKQQQQLEEMKKALKRVQAEAAKATKTAKEAKTSSPKMALPDYLSISGVVEVEANAAKSFANADSSDITLAKVETVIEAEPTDWTKATVILLYEDTTNDNLLVDEAFFTVANAKESPFSLQAGKFQVPFGDYTSDMNSSPLTKSMGATTEKALMLSYENHGFTGSAYIFNGDTKDAGDDTIEHYGAYAGYSTKLNQIDISGGVSYLSNIADANTITEKLTSGTALQNYVAGYGANFSVGIGNLALRFEHIKSETFKQAHLAFNSGDTTLAATAVQAVYTLPLGEREVTIAVAYENTDQALALELAEQRHGVTISTELLPGLNATLEHIREEDYQKGEGGTGEDSHTTILNLAVEF